MGEIRLDDPAFRDPFQALALARHELAAIPRDVRRNILAGVLLRFTREQKSVSKSVARMGDDPAMGFYCVTHGASPDGAPCGCVANKAANLSEGEKCNLAWTQVLSELYALAYVIGREAPPGIAPWSTAWGTALGEELQRDFQRIAGHGPLRPDPECPGCQDELERRKREGEGDKPGEGHGTHG
jgi:hypothetical protein